MMLKLDGYVLCKILKEDVCMSYIFVVFLMVKVIDVDWIMGLCIGVDVYLMKLF